MLEPLGRALTLLGLLVAALGLLLWLGPGLPSWLGRLPGDIRVERPGFRLYLPIATCLVLSVLLSLLLWILARWR